MTDTTFSAQQVPVFPEHRRNLRDMRPAAVPLYQEQIERFLVPDNSIGVGPPTLVAVAAAVVAPVPERPLSEFEFARLPNGCVLVADRFGAATGEGPTASEAFGAWDADARGVYHLLATSKVHRRLQPQYEFLRRLFG